MRETGFIKQNKEKWEKFERILKSNHRDPDQLSELFIQITDDLSYSRTFYPNRSVRVYLNNVAQQVFYSIYRTKSSKASGFWWFWKEDLPRAIWDARKDFLLSFAVFMLAVGIGVVSSMYDDQFARQILGDGYVEMTIDNIEAEDPMGVYKDSDEFSMLFAITWNNLRVAFMTFVMGCFAAVGSIFVLIRNGIMVGAFQYFFIERGLGMESALTIWMHGTLEISAIIIAGAAGITLGKGLVFPGTYSRLHAFVLSARKGLKIMLGITPIIIMAGFIESFITRYTEAPNALRAAAILTSLAFIVGYFVVYPWMRARSGWATPADEDKLPPTQARIFKFNNVKASGELFTDVFMFMREKVKYLLVAILPLAAAYAAGLLLMNFSFVRDVLYVDSFPLFVFFPIYHVNGSELFDYLERPELILFNWSVATFVMTQCFYWLARKGWKDLGKPVQSLGQFVMRQGYKIGIVNAVLSVLFFLPFWFGMFLFVFVFPIAVFWAFTSVIENRDPFSGLGRAFTLIGGGFGRLAGTYASVALLCILYFLLSGSPIALIYVEVLNFNFVFSEEDRKLAFTVLMVFVMVLGYGLILPLVYFGMGFQYFDLREVTEAVGLRERIKQIGIRKRAYGLETLE